MIAKVVHGYRPAGLLRYLFGPGKFEEHRNPRVVASWDSAPWLHHPDKLLAVEVDGEVVEPGEFDFDLGPLTTTMQELAEDAGLPVSNPPPMTPEWADRLRADDVPPDAPAWVKHYRYDRKKDAVVRRPGYVWHCPVRLHDDDPVLSDKQWEYIAERLMTATGIQQAGCRWIAVRHADNHIHLMATLVSETTGKRFYPKNDYRKLRKECERLERELGLIPTAGADKTALKEPTRAEKGKAQRRGKPITAREELRRIVSQCAAAASNADEFLDELIGEGLDPKTTHGADGRIRGYTVALPGDLTADGAQVRFSGTKLATDLTWPKLLARWASTPVADPPARSDDDRVSPADRRNVLEHTAAIVDQAAAEVRDGDGTSVDGIAHATGEVLAALARGREGREPGPLTDIAEQFDRAARTPHHVLPDHFGPLARELRHASRRIAAAGMLSGRGKEKLAMLALVFALAGLIAEIASWQQARGRIHQAAAARRVAGALPVLDQSDQQHRGTGVTAPSTAAGGTRRERAVVRHETTRLGERRPRGPRLS